LRKTPESLGSPTPAHRAACTPPLHNCTAHRAPSASPNAYRTNVTPVHHIQTFTPSYINCARLPRVWGHRHPRTAPHALHHCTTAPPTAPHPPHPTRIARMLHQYTTYKHSRPATSIAQDSREFGVTDTRAPRRMHSTIAQLHRPPRPIRLTQRVSHECYTSTPHTNIHAQLHQLRKTPESLGSPTPAHRAARTPPLHNCTAHRIGSASP